MRVNFSISGIFPIRYPDVAHLILWHKFNLDPAIGVSSLWPKMTVTCLVPTSSVSSHSILLLCRVLTWGSHPLLLASQERNQKGPLECFFLVFYGCDFIWWAGADMSYNRICGFFCDIWVQFLSYGLWLWRNPAGLWQPTEIWRYSSRYPSDPAFFKAFVGSSIAVVNHKSALMFNIRSGFVGCISVVCWLRRRIFGT